MVVMVHTTPNKKKAKGNSTWTGSIVATMGICGLGTSCSPSRGRVTGGGGMGDGGVVVKGDGVPTVVVGVGAAIAAPFLIVPSKPITEFPSPSNRNMELTNMSCTTRHL
ncbi:hypothetical protein F0562_030764 [Nyssa sinensis]|uniref:Uncharacterized protein n=1 Tax=Nyssa sinensis TaxID=561372 RepID=A0A5J5AZ70_9ASTE|nr:hypothetical protein F0562_030764 [Nyssa sinensis]